MGGSVPCWGCPVVADGVVDCVASLSTEMKPKAKREVPDRTYHLRRLEQGGLDRLDVRQVPARRGEAGAVKWKVGKGGGRLAPRRKVVVVRVAWT